jgi:phosphoadenosine phosphosulfate reductase
MPQQMHIQSISSTDELEKEATEWLRQSFYRKRALVCFSGGKDSIVSEKLASIAGIDYEIQSTMTGIDPPQLIRFIRKNYPTCKFVRPRQSFWHLLTTHNPPGGTGRGIKWCCTKIKEWPSLYHNISERIIGIRAEESPSRAKYGRINIIESKGRLLTHYYPIFAWKEWNVWEFIDKYNLPYPSLYDHGFDRIGCVICPNHHNRHHIYRERWPKHFDCFEKYVRIWWEKRLHQGKEMWHDSVDDFIQDWYIGKFYYYKPKRGQQCKDEKLHQCNFQFLSEAI